MTVYNLVKRIESGDAKRRLDILARDDGRVFRFEEAEHRIETHPYRYAYWCCILSSGLFSDAVAAECEARLSIAWLQNSD